MDKETLKKFCSDDITTPAICEPFSIGEFTYATNSHVAIRVPVVGWACMASPERHPMNIEKLFKKAHSGVSFRQHEKIILPEVKTETNPLPSKVPCDSCESHDCPSCSCIEDCEKCENGFISSENGYQIIQESAPVQIDGFFYDSFYIALLQENLLGLIFGEKKKEEDPIVFKFDGGIGLLIGRRGDSACTRIVTNVSKAA